MVAKRPAPTPRVCAHCNAAWTPDSPTAAQGGWDDHIDKGWPVRGAAEKMYATCSRACRKALGLRERYPVR